MKTFACIGFTAALLAGSVSGQSGVGVGFILGDPSGLSAKINSGENSINLVLGWNHGWDRRWHGGGLYLSGDYVWYYYFIPVHKGKLPLYFGPGVNASISNDPGLGIRGVAGIEYQFDGAPFDAFFELGPGIRVLPGTSGDVSGGIGARFFF